MRLTQHSRLALLGAVHSTGAVFGMVVWFGGGVARTAGAVRAAVARPSILTATPTPPGSSGAAEVRTSTHDQTGKLTFLGVDPRSAITLQGPPLGGLSAQARGQAILNVYGTYFGLEAPGNQLPAMAAAHGPNGGR